jgi:hypothetical protein
MSEHFTPEQQATLDAADEVLRRTREAPPEVRALIARKQAEVNAEHAREFPAYEQLRAERNALRAENEQQRDRITALEAKADLACAALVSAEKEIAALPSSKDPWPGSHAVVSLPDVLAIIDAHEAKSGIPESNSGVVTEGARCNECGMPGCNSPRCDDARARRMPSYERPARDVRLYANLSIAFMSVSEALMRCSTVFDALTEAAKEDKQNAQPN